MQFHFEENLLVSYKLIILKVSIKLILLKYG